MFHHYKYFFFAGFRNRGISLFFFLTLIGCYTPKDVELPALKSVFYPNESTVVFLNQTTGERKELHANQVTCHDKPTELYQSSLNNYKLFHPEICGQTIKAPSTQSNAMDHVICSETKHGSRWCTVGFERSFFRLYKSSSYSDYARFIDSLWLNNRLHLNVFVLPRKASNSAFPDIDSVYFSESEGVLQIIDSQHQKWIRQ